MLHTSDQTRAQLAFSKVSEVARRDENFKKKYSTACRRLPALIHQCGLCQALAFLQAKVKEDATQALLTDFSSAVLDMQTKNSREQLAAAAREKPFAEYQWLSRHALSTATWFKRYAEALLPTEDE
jgi:CRISPR-associated protein Cmr5